MFMACPLCKYICLKIYRLFIFRNLIAYISILKRTYQEFECALQEDLSKKMAKRLDSIFEFKTKLYHKKSDFVKEFTSFNDLCLDYFLTFFIYGFYFFSFLMLIKFLEIALIHKFKFR